MFERFASNASNITKIKVVIRFDKKWFLHFPPLISHSMHNTFSAVWFFQEEKITSWKMSLIRLSCSQQLVDFNKFPELHTHLSYSAYAR